MSDTERLTEQLDLALARESVAIQRAADHAERECVAEAKVRTLENEVRRLRRMLACADAAADRAAGLDPASSRILDEVFPRVTAADVERLIDNPLREQEDDK